ncbi:Type-2 restriction enzyme Sau3AI [Sulfurovum sp. enrichment culture clone C5]|uniref:Type-2 restriction enzyme Sau3AI n=1 Tax=Sulfurovum sp. enrichment culture clone C5 TaxID=497650 RepID=A0A0S4XNK5_9BACT|nr:Type-2 restriction enzyme Sau3AI [Sulfurovum sp. enrichment culture clone C5]
MNSLPYNLNDKNSIIKYAKQLVGKSLKDVCGKELFENQKNKGGFGQLLEKFYFLYEPNSDSEPDFKQVGLELKSSPIKRLKRLRYVSKERLVLNIINYVEVVNQEFNSSSFWKKNNNLLLVFYIYETGKEKVDYRIEIVDEWSFPEIDLEIIKKDWDVIRNKVKDGKAHELSEGDTLYLGACTKGSKGGNLRAQPNNNTKAKQRAYSLKQGYVNHIIATLIDGTKENYGKLIPSLAIAKTTSLEDIVISKFAKYYNKTIPNIEAELNLKLNPKAKNFYANLTKAILGIELKNEIEEFSKADIIVKTVRLNHDNLPKEHISFPAFKFEDIVEETWDNSSFKSILEHKFLFIFLKYDNEDLKLQKVKFWNMPYNDIKEVRKMWLKTKCVIKNGNIVKEIKFDKNGKERRLTNFPNKKFNHISHVRPHALNSKDTYKLPKIDKVTKDDVYTKHCFWLNDSYVKDYIFKD